MLLIIFDQKYYIVINVLNKFNNIFKLIFALLVYIKKKFTTMEFETWYRSLPFFTKHFLLGSFILAGLATFEIVPIYQ